MLQKYTVGLANFVNLGFRCFLVVGILTIFWPNIIPFGFWEFWTTKGSLSEAIVGAWPFYLFGIGVNAYYSFPTRNDYTVSPLQILVGGAGISLWAGVAEEICFRWLIFLGMILLMPIIDFVLLGFAGIHPVQWLYMDILAPIANFFTLGYLKPYIGGDYGWAVAAALMSSNGQFRNGHAYQGLHGLVISWFIGMYLFWVMFTYGLLAAIIIHFLYDLFIFIIVCIDAIQEKVQ